MLVYLAFVAEEEVITYYKIIKVYITNMLVEVVEPYIIYFKNCVGILNKYGVWVEMPICNTHFWNTYKRILNHIQKT
jgi:hypothetical protein